MFGNCENCCSLRTPAAKRPRRTRTHFQRSASARVVCVPKRCVPVPFSTMYIISIKFFSLELPVGRYNFFLAARGQRLFMLSTWQQFWVWIYVMPSGIIPNGASLNMKMGTTRMEKRKIVHSPQQMSRESRVGEIIWWWYEISDFRATGRMKNDSYIDILIDLLTYIPIYNRRTRNKVPKSKGSTMMMMVSNCSTF
jgi:hypothetical protein